MNFTEFRLKVRRFFRNNKKLLLIVVIIWAIIFFVNKIFSNKPIEYTAETSYEAHTAVINDSNQTPQKLQQPIEDLIDEYIGYCNEGNYQRAFDLLSDDCKEYAFNNDITEFMTHVLEKMPTEKVHSIQNYSSIKHNGENLYIYEIKYTDDFLATGLTNTDYSFTSENITFFEGKDGLEMNVGNFMYHKDIKSISENEYLKIDVIDKIVNYSIEEYEVTFTNRSEYTIVISDKQEKDEITLVLQNEVRNRTDVADIILEPSESVTLKFTFPKFVDDGDVSKSLSFPAIRVMEKYSGTEGIEEAVIQSEIDNAIAKFSMDVGVDK